jgi:hypothetical protein
LGQYPLLILEPRTNGTQVHQTGAFASRKSTPCHPPSEPVSIDKTLLNSLNPWSRPRITTNIHAKATMNSYISWAIFLAILGGLSWHYAGRPTLLTRFGSQSPSDPSSQQASGASTRKPKAKARRAGDTDNVGNEIKPAHQLPSAEGNGSKKRKIATRQVSGGANAFSSGTGEVTSPSTTISETNQNVTNNADFAREMAVARAGTQFATSGKPGMSKERRAQKQDSLRPGNDTDSPYLSTGASSTTGGDADDDLSPVASPPLEATSTVVTSKSGDVSDMLEPSSAGPSILRLTNPTNPVTKARAKQASKAFEPAETKKQRQQRIKRETQRAQAEEAERERQRLMEKQIRGARMAGGTSAQTRTSAFKPPAENAWFPAPVNPSANAINAPAAQPPSLLDTFEPEARPTASGENEVSTAPLTSMRSPNISAESKPNSIGAVKETGRGKSSNAFATSGKQEKDWAKDFPIEEEQMRLIQDSEDSWTTVSKRDKKKASKANESKEVDTSEAIGVESRHANGNGPKGAASSRPAFSSDSNSYHQLGDSGFQDSDWAA